jgi:2-aminoadipate transaminase
MLSLAGGLPAAEALDPAPFRRAFERVLQQVGPYGPVALQYGPTEGLAELRALIARDAHELDGRSAADDVLVTTGSQQAIDLITRVLIDPGDVVVAEQPAYLGSLQAIAAAGAQVVSVAVDADGMRTDELEHELRRGLRPKLCSVVPNFQNPSGATLTADRRAHLGALAEHYGFVIVEDDPYRELRFKGPPLPPIRRHTDLAITLGSTSKVLAPGLRVGWAIAPAALRGPMVRAKQAADLHTSTTTQLLAHDLLADGAFMHEHIAALRTCYSTRCDALVVALRAELGAAADLTEPDGGFFVWARLRDIDTAALLPHALDEGVAFVPGNAFTTDRSCDDRARLSFASLPADGLAEAARRLRRAISRTPPVLVSTSPFW